MMTKIMTYIVMAFVFGVVINGVEAVNCANSSNVKYELTIGGGATTVKDGETPAAFTADINPTGTSVTAPTWSLDPTGGGGNGTLTTPVITPSANGMSATIQFFWHSAAPNSTTCTYKLECTTAATCVATKSITVYLPSEREWAGTGYNLTVSMVLDPVLTNKIVGITVTLTEDAGESHNDLLHADSQFMNKITKHEAEHVKDLNNGDAAARALLVGLIYLNTKNYMNNEYDFNTRLAIATEVKDEIELKVTGPKGTTSWMEMRAFGVSDALNPDYFEPNN